MRRLCKSLVSLVLGGCFVFLASGAAKVPDKQPIIGMEKATSEYTYMTEVVISDPVLGDEVVRVRYDGLQSKDEVKANVVSLLVEGGTELGFTTQGDDAEAYWENRVTVGNTYQKIA